MLKLFGQAHDINRIKRTLLDADATPHTQFFRNDCFTVFADDNRFIPGPHPGTIQYTLGSTLFGMAAVFVNNSNSHEITKKDGLVHYPDNEVSRIVHVMNQNAKVINPW